MLKISELVQESCVHSVVETQSSHQGHRILSDQNEFLGRIICRVTQTTSKTNVLAEQRKLSDEGKKTMEQRVAWRPNTHVYLSRFTSAHYSIVS